MGNSLGGKKSAKVMKITGETFKLKTPIRAGSVVEKHPGYVLLESEAVKHYGVRAKPLEPQQELKAKRLYFLVELPKFAPEDHKVTRRVRSGIQMSAKDRLESMMLARRSSSDLSIMKPISSTFSSSSTTTIDDHEKNVTTATGGGVRVRMRLPKAEVERLMAESKDRDEVAQKIVGLCMGNAAGSHHVAAEISTNNNNNHNVMMMSNNNWKANDRDHDYHHRGGMVKQVTKSPRDQQKRVGFLPMINSHEGEIYLAAASY